MLKDRAQDTNGSGLSTGFIDDEGPRHASRHAFSRKTSTHRWRLVPQHLRPRSVRAKIVALLMVPVVSLMALWGFATVTTAQSVGDLQRFQDVNSTLVQPVNDLIQAIQQERSDVVQFIASGRDAARQDAWETVAQGTDAAIGDLRSNVNASSTEITALDAELPDRIDAFLDAADKLADDRQQVRSSGRWDVVYDAYTQTIEAGFAIGGALTGIQQTDSTAAEAASDTRVVLEMARAREMVAREDALVGAALAAEEMSLDQYNGFVGAAYAQRAMLTSSVDDLRGSDAAAYRKILESEPYAELGRLETAIETVGPDEALDEVQRDSWDSTATAVLVDLAKAQSQASTVAASKVDPFSLDVLGGSGLAVVLGLVGVLLSLVISVQIGRGLVIDLVDLRNQAMELAGHKLPQTLKRLHTGEEIDVDREAPMPRQQGDEGEVAQVAEALNAVHRSAIRSAIERAEALSGISQVYVYLARRSQVLLHRQLALLDTMERRIDDPDELEDLFRLDHLTTRMRRLAESLIILSGAAPARGWRKPVPLIDVVRAAVAEVEEFTRVDVHELPEIKMAGSVVADLTHLLAELIENAVVFSPPHTQAHVRGQLVGAGLAIEIEDRGLGMSQNALEDANRRIEDADQVDLLETDQLGLFVVNRLAHRHNIKVTLQPSPYGGVTAVVLVPDGLIDKTSDDDERVEPTLSSSQNWASHYGRPQALPPARTAAPVPPPSEPRSSDLPTVPPVPPPSLSPTNPWARDDGIRSPVQPVNGDEATPPPSLGEWSVRPDLGSDKPVRSVDADETPTDPRVEVPVISSDEPSAAESAAPPESAPDGVSAAQQDVPDDGALPRRVRQASLAPQLRGDQPGTSAADVDDEPESRSPDEARATMAAMRSGWLRGQADPPPSPGADAEPAGGMSQQDTSHGEGK